MRNALEAVKSAFNVSKLDKYGQMGVAALALATPYDTGETAMSWSYEISFENNIATIEFKNSNITSQGTPVAILLQYGHATGGGGYVEGIDYINPALRPVFERMANDAWMEARVKI